MKNIEIKIEDKFMKERKVKGLNNNYLMQGNSTGTNRKLREAFNHCSE